YSDITSNLAAFSPLKSRLFEIEVAAARLQECTAALRGRVNRRLADAKKSGLYDEVEFDAPGDMRTVQWTLASGKNGPAFNDLTEGDSLRKKVVISHHKCLPDTVDPRKK